MIGRPAPHRYVALASQARALAKTADRLIDNAAYRSAAKVLGDAALILATAADERELALGVSPGDLLRRQLEESLARLTAEGGR